MVLGRILQINIIYSGESIMQKKKYEVPNVSVTQITESDILSGSDVLIDGKDLFEEE